MTHLEDFHDPDELLEQFHIAGRNLYVGAFALEEIDQEPMMAYKPLELIELDFDRIITPAQAVSIGNPLVRESLIIHMQPSYALMQPGYRVGTLTAEDVKTTYVGYLRDGNVLTVNHHLADDKTFLTQSLLSALEFLNAGQTYIESDDFGDKDAYQILQSIAEMGDPHQASTGPIKHSWHIGYREDVMVNGQEEASYIQGLAEHLKQCIQSWSDDIELGSGTSESLERLKERLATARLSYQHTLKYLG